MIIFEVIPANTQNYNKYEYVMNNPMMYNDPTGEFWAWFIGSLVGSYFSGVQANHGNFNPVKWDWKNTWTAVVGGAFAGAAIGQGVSDINVYGTKFIANSVIGSVGSIFNGIATGQNIFKSALIGFSGINYTINLSSSEGINAGYKYIISPNYNDFYTPEQENPVAPWYFDKKGEELLNHWLGGSGKNLNFTHDKGWSDYMSKNGFIRDELVKRAVARSYMMYSEGKTKYSETSGNFGFEIDNTYNTGYGMLHGTQYFSYFMNGKYVKSTDSYVFNFNLKWTDQINHNNNVLMDRVFSGIARSAARPADYWITIKWAQTIIIKSKEWERLR
ncbi:hypothetical protein [Chryseobacterium sp. JM1]|uniref:hypothetical protein n=1 Tax=Chryseobacterium sp. JM1 TaxID=1233950 RepID=UPI0004E657FD|nr:hypothetical protein [Chryseobacterium sp. JM1]KFF23050.1 hypothetical protein IW22_02100 [Chryseobacterium sp. JM1]